MQTRQHSGDENLSREDAAARASVIDLDTIEVDLDVRSASDASRDDFATQSTLRFRASAAETWVDFLGVAVDEVELNGAPQPVEWDGARIRLSGLAEDNTVRIRARGRYSRSGEGLHRFTDPVDGAVYLYTQYEPADSRRVYPCFEQPDLKARWTFHITASGDGVVLSGGAETSRLDVDGGAPLRQACGLPPALRGEEGGRCQSAPRRPPRRSCPQVRIDGRFSSDQSEKPSPR